MVAFRAAYRSSTSSPLLGLYDNSESMHLPVMAKRSSGISIACAIACTLLFVERTTSMAVCPTVWYMKESSSLIFAFSVESAFRGESYPEGDSRDTQSRVRASHTGACCSRNPFLHLAEQQSSWRGITREERVEGKPIVKWERAVSEQTGAAEVARKSSDI